MPHENRPKKTRTVARPRRKDAATTETRSRSKRGRKVGSRARAGGDIRGAVGTVRGQYALVRLLEALEAEKIRYVMIGMSAAIAQGVMTNTLDVVGHSHG